MPSDNALTLINRVLRTTGDYSQLTTVVGSPAGIAERIIDYMNIVLKDIVRKVEFPELLSKFQATADGINSIYTSTLSFATVGSGVSVIIDGIGKMEEISPTRLDEMRAQPFIQGIYGRPQYFARIAGLNNQLAVDVYPTPQANSIITVSTYLSPTLFTPIDTSITELSNNDIIVLGTLAHLDAYDGLERGYMALYEKAKNDMWQHMVQGEQYRIQPESYK